MVVVVVVLLLVVDFVCLAEEMFGEGLKLIPRG